MRTNKLTPLGRLMIFLLAVILILGGGYMWKGKDLFSVNGKLKNKVKDLAKNDDHTLMNTDGAVDFNISLDEWIGWKPYIDANGGLTTAKGSINDKLGIKVNYSIINDATQSSNAVIAKQLDGAGYTVNRYAFLYSKFIENKTPVKMVHIMNSSYGGDGIIGLDKIKSVNDLVGKKVGYPKFSEAQTLVQWVLNKSSLTADQKAQIKTIPFDTPDDAAKAFFANQVDAAATWQPFLTQATSTTGARVIFSTKSASNIILDGLVLRESVATAKADKVQKLIEGALQAKASYTGDVTAMQNSMPLFAGMSDKEIKDMTGDAKIFNWAENKDSLSGTAQALFADMSDIWKGLGEKADASNASQAFDSSYLMALSSKFPTEKVETVKITDAQKEEAKKQDNSEALIKQSLSINFESGAAQIKDDSFKALNDFANTAKILNGVVIQIEGNTDSVGDDASNLALSQARAQSIARYLQAQGVDASRFVVIGNGETKPVGDNNTEAGRAANRRTDIFFKVVK